MHAFWPMSVPVRGYCYTVWLEGELTFRHKIGVIGPLWRQSIPIRLKSEGLGISHRNCGFPQGTAIFRVCRCRLRSADSLPVNLEIVLRQEAKVGCVAPGGKSRVPSPLGNAPYQSLLSLYCQISI